MGLSDIAFGGRNFIFCLLSVIKYGTTFVLWNVEEPICSAALRLQGFLYSSNLSDAMNFIGEQNFKDDYMSAA